MDYADMVSMVVPGLSGIPSFVVEDKIRDTVIEFCRRTWAYEQDLDAITTTAGNDTYTLTTPNDTEILSVLSVRDSNDSPLGFALSADYSSIKLLTEPTSEFSFTVKAVLTPGPESTDFPDFIFNRYREELVAGAKGKCFEMTGRPWFNGQAAGYNLKKFKKGITTAVMSRQNQRLSGSRVEMRTWV